MIKHFRHRGIDKKKWDEAIANSANGMIYAYSWYLDIACPDWEALIENDYEFVMPLTKRKKYGVNYLFPPFFTQQLGVFSRNQISEEKLKEFLNLIPEGIKFIEINLNTQNTVFSGNFSVKQNLTYELDLSAAYEEMYKSYSDNAKRNLKKAEKNNLIFSNSIPADEVMKMFRQNRGKEISSLKERDYETLKALMKADRKSVV